MAIRVTLDRILLEVVRADEPRQAIVEALARQVKLLAQLILVVVVTRVILLLRCRHDELLLDGASRTARRALIF